MGFIYISLQDCDIAGNLLILYYPPNKFIYKIKWKESIGHFLINSNFTGIILK